MSRIMQEQSLRDLNLDGVFFLEDKKFLVHFSDKAPQYSKYSDPVLVTVFTVLREPPITITSTWLQSIIANQQKEDDVFQTAFLQGIILFGPEEKDVQITVDAHDYLKTLGTEWINCLAAGSQQPLESILAPGPYVLVEGRLEEVWRLHSDTNGAFLTAVQPGQTNPFLCLQSPVAEDGFLDVAVPSRLKFSSSKLQLAGLRVAVKDNFHLKGLKTSLGNRAYYQTYPSASVTAVCIQQLIDLGAIVLGKTKLNSFGTWEEPTEYVDYQAPWNPRADGYQSPGGSSSGSGAAIGAYDWVDIAIGSDTGGSISRPGLWNGCFAMRPSLGAVSVEGLVASIRLFDMPGFLGRDLQKLRNFATTWYADILPKGTLKKFSRIIWPTDYWTTINPEQCDIAEKFVQDMEASLDLNHEKISFQEEWIKSLPQNLGTVTLDEYMKDALIHVWYDDYHAHDHFREEYWQKYNKAPYISPAVREVWKECKGITKAQRDEGVTRLEVYRTWFHKNIMSADTGHSLLILPIENMASRYRDEPPTFDRGGSGVVSLLLAPVIEAPELVVPDGVGEVQYTSKVTEREESLPFAVGLMGLPGSDHMLIDAALACLQSSGRPTVMYTGRSAFKR